MPTLFEEIVVGPLRLRNRLAFPATIGNLGTSEAPTDEQIAYYERRARGGVGLIVTEGVTVHSSSQPNAAVVQAYNPKARRGLQHLAAASKHHGAAILLQLWHAGRQQLWGPTRSPWGASSLPDAFSGVVPHVMTLDEVAEVEQAFVTCAQVARDAGFDGVEVHGAHGYLVTQFLSPWSNNRTDIYGGSFENRMRFVRNLLGGIRQACGPEFAIGLKLSGSEFVEGGLTAQDTRAIISDLDGRGLLDLVSINQGNFSLSLERHVPDMHFSQAPFADVVRAVRPSGDGVAIMAIGRIIDRDVAEGLVADGTADLIGMARGLISDPDLPRLWQAGDESHVRRCISCNLCWGIIVGSKRIACIHNSETGNELKHAAPARSSSRRTVHVIGGGPAGMEAAWVAASRGHDVHLWEASSALGGQLRALAALPGLGEYGGIVAYQGARLAENGVIVHLNHTVSAGEIAAWDDGAVVLATGSEPQAAPRSLNGMHTFGPDATGDIPAAAPNASAIVFDEDGAYAAYGAVDLLLERGYAVTLATSRMEIASGLDYLSKIGTQRRLRGGDVAMLTGVESARVESDALVLRDCYSGRERRLPKPALAVWAGPRAARDDLAAAAGKHAFTVIGDAISPRRIISAIHEGYAAGCAV